MKRIKHFSTLIVVAILLWSCRSAHQSSKSSKGVQYILIDSTLLDTIPQNLEEYHIKKYADSINRITNSGQLPGFLEETEMDTNVEGFIYPRNSKLSCREMIFKEVTSCRALKLITESANEKLKRKPVNKFGRRTDEMSFHDIAKARMIELGCSMFN
ncbi:MAG: hypothetical protein NTW29_13025 [Bacteroidetes bacterium]|nr:hypothetical protein [Bacteroidota bacterium]